MVKILITKLLSDTIRDERKKNNIIASKLAYELGKSEAYISKIENQTLKKMDLDMLFLVFEFIFKNSQSISQSVEKLLKDIYSSNDNIDEEDITWLTILEYKYIEFEIPNELIQSISDILDEFGIDTYGIIESLNNMNSADDQHEKNCVFFEPSTMYTPQIIHKLELNYLEKILDGDVRKINYIVLRDILVNILMKMKNSQTYKVSDASDWLYQYNVHTLEEKYNIERSKARETHVSEVIKKYDKTNVELITKLVEMLNSMSEWDIEYTNRMLNNLMKSFEADSSLMLSILGLEFYKLGGLSTENKATFKNRIESSIENFSTMEYKERDYMRY